MGPIGKQELKEGQTFVSQTGSRKRSEVLNNVATDDRSEVVTGGVNALLGACDSVVAGSDTAATTNSESVKQRAKAAVLNFNQYMDRGQLENAARPNILPDPDKGVGEVTPDQISKLLVQAKAVGGVSGQRVTLATVGLCGSIKNTEAVSVQKATVLKEAIVQTTKPIRKVDRRPLSKKNIAQLKPTKAAQILGAVKMRGPHLVQDRRHFSDSNRAPILVFNQRRRNDPDTEPAVVTEQAQNGGHKRNINYTPVARPASHLRIGISQKAQLPQHLKTAGNVRSARTTDTAQATRCSREVMLSCKTGVCLSLDATGTPKTSRTIRTSGDAESNRSAIKCKALQSSVSTRNGKHGRDEQPSLNTHVVEEKVTNRETRAASSALISRNASATGRNAKYGPSFTLPSTHRRRTCVKGAKTPQASSTVEADSCGRATAKASQNARLRSVRDTGAQGDAKKIGHVRQTLVMEGTGDCSRKHICSGNGVIWRFGYRGKNRGARILFRNRSKTPGRVRSFSTNQLTTRAQDRRGKAAVEVRPGNRQRTTQEARDFGKNRSVARGHTARRRASAKVGNRRHRCRTNAAESRSHLVLDPGTMIGRIYIPSRARARIRPARNQNQWARWRLWGRQCRWSRRIQPSINTSSGSGSSSSTRARYGSRLRGGFSSSGECSGSERSEYEDEDLDYSDDGCEEVSSWQSMDASTEAEDDNELNVYDLRQDKTERNGYFLERNEDVLEEETNECHKTPQKFGQRAQFTQVNAKTAHVQRDRSRVKESKKRDGAKGIRRSVKELKTGSKCEVIPRKEMSRRKKKIAKKLSPVVIAAGSTGLHGDENPEQETKNRSDRRGRQGRTKSPFKAKSPTRNKGTTIIKRTKKVRGRSLPPAKTDEEFGNTVDWTKSIRWAKATDWTIRSMKKSTTPTPTPTPAPRVPAKKKKPRKFEDTEQPIQPDEPGEPVAGSSPTMDELEQALVNTRGPTGAGIRMAKSARSIGITCAFPRPCKSYARHNLSTKQLSPGSREISMEHRHCESDKPDENRACFGLQNFSSRRRSPTRQSALRSKSYTRCRSEGPSYGVVLFASEKRKSSIRGVVSDVAWDRRHIRFSSIDASHTGARSSTNEEHPTERESSTN